MNRIFYTFAVVILFAASAFAKIIRVPADQPTIQAAINAATQGDTVLVADGSYFENINFRGKAITVASHYFMDGDTSHVNNTIIDGSRSSHPDSGSVVHLVSGEDTTSVLYGFTITNGTGTVYTVSWRGEARRYRSGGGISGGGGRILFNKIINNTAIQAFAYASGGGIGVGTGKPDYVIIRGNHISNNAVSGVNGTNGGGVVIFCNGEVSDNIISSNSCTATTGYAAGGGMECASDPTTALTFQVIIKNNTITHNSATSQTSEGYGGGLFINQASVSVLNNEISHNELRAGSNRSAEGGGLTLWSVDNKPFVSGNIIAHNKVSRGVGYGGGIYLGDGSNAVMINNTITGNNAQIGGGIYCYLSNPVVMNTILWNNQATSGSEIYRASGSMTVAYSDVKGGWSGQGNINADPAFADTLFHLSNSSPCINRGIDSLQVSGTWYYCPPFDIAGHIRPYPSTVSDMGAYETDVITAVAEQRSAAAPEHFALHQNYPNPFNPTTTIAFALPKPGFVTLKIYNTLGKAVATLVSEKLPSGKHQRVWETNGLASGVYVYRLQADEFVQTRKLVLLK